MYKYETHLHTSPVSKCANATVEDTLRFYKELGYDGVFITNHFLDGNINIDKSLPYEEKINFYFSDYEDGVRLADEIGIKVFLGVELTYSGTDFLVYGLDKNWFLAHPEIMDMKKSEELVFLMENGALVVHAHPFREARYIDHIRLFPRGIQGVEIINASRTDFENEMAENYAKSYGFVTLAGSDNHSGKTKKNLAGIMTDTPITDESDFCRRVLDGNVQLFKMSNPYLES